MRMATREGKGFVRVHRVKISMIVWWVTIFRFSTCASSYALTRLPEVRIYW